MNNDLISREALKKAFEKVYPLATNEMGGVANKRIYDIIDNAPTVEHEVYMTAKDYNLYLEGYKQGKKDFGEPQGKCKSCRHRDPEDKKCDCGGLERQGCPFPVSDDYYCKYYEKGGAE